MALRTLLRARLVATLLCAATAACPATLGRYPYLQNVRTDRATILWTTAEPGAGAVQYSTDRSYARTAPARVREFPSSETRMPSPYYLHNAELTGLHPNTEYYYRVLVDGQTLASGDELRFRTAGPGPFRFLAFGDSGLDTPAQRQIAQRMLEERFALVLHTGDLEQSTGSFALFEITYFGYYRDLMKRAPFYPTSGNHDYLTSNAAPYLAVHSLPTEGVPPADAGRYYSFDWGNVHFISLDTNTPLEQAVRGTGSMLEWLERDLGRTRQYWRVVLFHHPPYASGIHEKQTTPAWIRNWVVPILDRHGVDLVFSGHEHSYQRSWPLRDGVPVADGAVYITSGGGGAQLYPISPRPFLAFQESAYHYVRGEVEGTRMTLRAIRIDGVQIDRVTLAPAPLVPDGAAVNSASFTPGLAPGSLISVFGQYLAAEETRAASLPLATELAGTSLSVNGRRLPLLYVSPSQINAQLPYDLEGWVSLQALTPNGSAETPVFISETAPAVFYSLTESGRQPAVVHRSGALVSPADPAAPGEVITLYLTGLGRVDGSIGAGQPAPSSPPLAARVPVEARLAGTLIRPSFAGLAPGYAGLYQVDIQVPSELAGGVYELRLLARGVASEALSLAVRSPAGQSQGLLQPARRRAAQPDSGSLPGAPGPRSSR